MREKFWKKEKKNPKIFEEKKENQLIRPGCNCDMVLGGKCMKNSFKDVINCN